MEFGWAVSQWTEADINWAVSGDEAGKQARFHLLSARSQLIKHTETQMCNQITIVFLVLYHRQLDLFQFTEDVSPHVQASSLLTNCRVVAGF